jgi:RNA polymerase sigma factor (sigma-70 family)
MTSTGLEAIFLENRDRLRRFLVAHGAGDAAEDLLQELWLKVAAAPDGPVAQPLSYLYRAANNLMLDRYRSTQQAAKRDSDWTDAATTAPGRSDEPSSERKLIAREQLRLAQDALAALGDRPATIFRRHRIDGIAQRDIAAELGISLSTVEADLRRAYAAMIALRKRFDDG